jgi:hypothetical protein
MAQPAPAGPVVPSQGAAAPTRFPQHPHAVLNRRSHPAPHALPRSSS